MTAQTPRVLIVDDEPQIRRLLEAIFLDAGYHVRTADSAATAIALLDSEHCDLLLSDVNMPGQNGHELARWVARRRPETRTILMSGYDGVGCRNCGVPVRRCGLLRKPFAAQELLAMAASSL